MNVSLEVLSVVAGQGEDRVAVLYCKVLSVQVMFKLSRSKINECKDCKERVSLTISLPFSLLSLQCSSGSLPFLSDLCTLKYISLYR